MRGFPVKSDRYQSQSLIRDQDIGHHPTDMQATRDFASVNSVQSFDFTISLCAIRKRFWLASLGTIRFQLPPAALGQ